MSDPRRTDLSQPTSSVPADDPVAGRLLQNSAFKKRWPYYAAAVILGICALAWIDGGEEPLHPITQAVELKTPVGGA